MKILIGTPATDSVDTLFYISMIRLIKENPEVDIKVPIGSTIHMARDEIALEAISGGYDYVMFIDTDTIFPPVVLKRFIDYQKDMVAGACIQRGAPFDPLVYELTDKWRPVTEFPKELSRVDGVGSGCCLLIKTEVLEDVLRKEKSLFEPFDRMSEDLSFFTRTKRQGKELWLDPEIELGHMGKTMYTPEHWRLLHESERDSE